MIYFAGKDGFKASIKSTNRNDVVSNVGLTYYIPKKTVNLKVTDISSGRPLNFDYDKSAKVLRVKVDELKPLEKLKIKVDF